MMIRSLLLLFILSLFGSFASASAATPTVPKADETQFALEKKVAAQLAGMSLEEKVGQLFIIAADENFENLIRTYHVGGVILFSRHTRSLSDTMQLIEQVRQAAPLSPFIAVDQEGGRVSRLSFATTIPTARSVGNHSAGALQQMGMLVGRELQALGFNLNFAPVLDVDTCKENPVIGNRSFGDDPYVVAQLGSAYIRGLHNSGILSAAKHFPGHGDTSSDSHFVLPIVNQSRDRLETVEMLPFRVALRSDVDMIMAAHVHYPALDPTPNLPASLSQSILTGILRQEMGFRGIIITDAMNMRAITNLMDSGQAAQSAFQAGADIILMPQDLPVAYHALLSSVKTGEISITRVDESVRRILSLKLRFPEGRTLPFDARLKHASDIVGSPAHKLELEQLLK